MITTTECILLIFTLLEINIFSTSKTKLSMALMYMVFGQYFSCRSQVLYSNLMPVFIKVLCKIKQLDHVDCHLNLLRCEEFYRSLCVKDLAVWNCSCKNLILMVVRRGAKYVVVLCKLSHKTVQKGPFSVIFSLS